NAGYLRITTTMDPRAVGPLHREHDYDLILLDLQMPGMDGFEVMEGLKEIESEGYLPVLVVTAQPGHKLRALQAGAKDFVGKPFDLVEVQTRIHNMLEVRLLYRKLNNYNQMLERTVLDRTAALRESEARFQRFTELSSDWYWEQDADGVLTRHCGPVLEMLGLGGDGAQAGAAQGWDADERALLTANIASRRPFLDFIYSRTHADGRKQYLQVSGEPMFDSGSRFTGYRGIGMDVTERMRPDREHLRLRRALDVIDHGVLLADPVTLRLTDMNQAACAMSGYGREELLALELAQLGIGDGAQLAGIFDALIAGGPGHTQTVRLRGKDGADLAAVLDWRAVKVEQQWVMVGVISLKCSA
ncbi:MAG TPA: response regulator, partial [Janthinobacterium sp.]|nr:response regulator [Janthinobacterium sp.]